MLNSFSRTGVIDALFWRGVCYLFCFCAYQEAQESLVKALKLNPNRADCLLLMALIAQEYEKDLQKAIFYTKKSIELAPNWPGSYHRLATLLLEQGKTEEAEVIARKGIAYEQPLRHFIDDIQRYFELVITGRASCPSDTSWEYLLMNIKKAKQKINK